MTEDDTPESENDDTPVGGKKKLVIIIGALLLLAGAGAHFGGLLDGGKKDEKEVAEQTAETAEAPVGKDGKPIVGPVYFELPEFLVNLSTTGRKASFLKMKVTLELKDEASKLIIEQNKPRIIDIMNTYLRELRASDLAGSAGIYRLRGELLTRVNKVVETGMVKDILFGEMIVQ